jgi:hypothetical protein
MKKPKSLARGRTIVLLILGLGLLVTHIVWEHYLDLKTNNETKTTFDLKTGQVIASVSSHSEDNIFKKTIAELLRDLGIAIILVVIVNILVEFQDWQNYFRARLKEIVIEKEYLRTLNEDELLKLQTDSFKAYFKNDNIDRGESFYNYFTDEVRALINTPYREDVKIVTTFTDSDILGQFNCLDEIQYSCRAAKDLIQEKILWYSEPDYNINETTKFEIELSLPTNLSEESKNKIGYYNEFKDGIIKFTQAGSNTSAPRIEKLTMEKDKCLGFCLSLKDLLHVDNLCVKISASYTADSRKIFALSQPNLTHKFDLRLIYPENYILHAETFGMVKESEKTEKKDKDYMVRYGSWLFREYGIAFSFQKK